MFALQNDKEMFYAATVYSHPHFVKTGQAAAKWDFENDRILLMVKRQVEALIEGELKIVRV